MRIADRTARGLMTPRHEVEIAAADETRAQILERFRTSGHSRLPLRDGGPDELVGIIKSSDLLYTFDATFEARALAVPVPVIHEALPAMQQIETMRGAPGHVLFVYDEYGHFEGIIRPMDILGAIAGGFDEEASYEPKVVERENGLLLVAGWMQVDEFAGRLSLRIGEDPDFATVAGLVLDHAKELPKVGQVVTVGGWRIEVVDLDGRRIDKLLVSRMPTDPSTG